MFIAENSAVLDRVLGLELVAQTSARALRAADVLERVRAALLDERWADALVDWMTATDLVVDVYDDEPVWTDDDLDIEAAAFEIRVAPIFAD